MQIYTVLDGASIVGLPEILANSGLNHCCLFRGAAREDMGDIGPWLVQLTGQSALTKTLFTDDTPPLGLWQYSGFFLQSAENLDKVANHLRYFTRLRDTSDKWFYFRFWEPDYVSAYLKAMTIEEQTAFLGGNLLARIITTGPTGHIFARPS